MITEFSPDVVAQLNYYVYRLIDPRNGQTFYVGKGKGNRVFQHVKCAIDYYDGAEDIDEEDPNKFKTIQNIRDSGLEVIHIIQRWNLTESEAFQVESALIDAYQGLSNIQSGHHSDFGVTNAEELQSRLSMKTYDEPTDFKYLIIKVRWWTLYQLMSEFPTDYRYEATRREWKIKPRSIKEYKYVFSVTDGIVKEVYKIKNWYNSPDESSSRYAFNGEIAEEEIRARFKNTRIPDKYCKKGMASPVLFSKN